MKMPWQILHVDTERSWRGGERQALWLMQLLPGDEFESILAAPIETPFAVQAAAAGKRVVHFSLWGEWDIFAAWKLKGLIAKNNVSLVHAHSSHALGVAACARKLHPFKLVASRRVDFHLRKNMFSRWKYAQADHIIAISDAIRQVLISDGIPSTRIRVVKSGIRIRETKPIDRDQIKQTIRIPKNNKVVGMVAALAPHKDHRTFLEAARIIKNQLPGVTFLIVGEGPLYRSVTDTIQELGLKQQVVMTGFREDVSDLIGIMDVYAVSSYLEGMGTSTLDAMQAGRPVVATRVGGIPEIVEDGVTGYLVGPRDPGALAEKIIGLLNDEKTARAMGEKGMNRSRQFSVENTAQGTAQVYREILG